MGFALVLFPVSTLLAADTAMRSVLARLRADGTPAGVLDEIGGLDGFADREGLAEIREMETRFSS